MVRPSTTTFSGGTLATGTISTIDASVGTVTTVTIAQNLTGGGGIRLIGTDGTGGNALTNFTFTGDNDYTGATINCGRNPGRPAAANIQNSSSISILATNNSIGTLNLNLAANGLAFAGSLAGSGNLNINFFDPSGDTFAIKNIGTFTGAITLGANGNAGTLQVYGGTYGNISDAGSGSGVTIRRRTSPQSVRFYHSNQRHGHDWQCDLYRPDHGQFEVHP